MNGLFVSCNKMIDELDTDPEKAILGKWELVLLTRNVGDEIQHTPTGYIEYLPDSLMAWYDYATRKRTLLESKYWLEEGVSSDVDFPHTYWILHYQGFSIESYPDSFGCNEYQCTFFSNNRMGLDPMVLALIKCYTHIYERKK